MMRHRLSGSLSRREASLIRGFIDGCLDAGACEDGITGEERDALWRMMEILDRIDQRKEAGA